jgi:hypothetical protein
MDIIGHLAVIDAAGIVPPDKLWSTDALPALFPNLAHCHQWAYETLWDVHRRSEEHTARIIQAHMICDWVIHYGPDATGVRERVGWAYQEMGAAAACLDPFMDEVVRRGWVRADPRVVDGRDHLERDFAHTAVECALDVHVAPQVADRHIVALRRELARLAQPEFFSQFVATTFAATGGFTCEPVAVLDRTAADYGRWSALVQEPCEFAALTLCAKYGVEESFDALAFAVDFIESIAGNLDRDRRKRMFEQIAERIADPERALTSR